MNLVRFRFRGRFAHFLRAEANVSALGYPIPPRTVLLGLLGAVLGLEKDLPQVALEPALIAVAGQLPATHWHNAKFRKDPPAALPIVIRRTMTRREEGAPERATMVNQEWLLDPDFTVWAGLSEPWLGDLSARLRDRRWYFSPCLGLSEMLADLTWEADVEGTPLPSGNHRISTVIPRDSGEIDLDTVFAESLTLHALSMPRAVTAERVFSHAGYFAEKNARPVPVRTTQAIAAGEHIILFM